ncbi:MAG TPA: HRDC domain-containing protein, partial [Candidatus Binatus sp.]|nr:HRDC domain-containing protein [Candidatus Binatus sp.]
DFIYVSDGAALRALVERITGAVKVAVDTEADSLHNYFEKVCLIQLSLGGAHYIVDPLAGLELGGFLEALAAKPLIFHGGDYDLRMLRASTGFKARGEVFDTMIAAQLLGIEQIGLAALIERYFNIKIGKEGQKSDWSRRPLSDQQLSYAVNDTRYLERLAECLTGELRERGRSDWHRESCRAMVASTERDRVRNPDDTWRIKGAGRLTRRQLAYLRELWHWRDQLARSANRPPFMILGNQQILELIAWVDSHLGAPLEQGPKLPRNIRGHLLTTLAEAIKRASEMAEAQWPQLKKREHGEPLSAELAKRIDALRAECARIAKELAIAPSIVAPKAALEAIGRKHPRTVDEIMESGPLLRWQAELVQDSVEKCFS